MGIYIRKDSPKWQMELPKDPLHPERPPRRTSTGIDWNVGTKRSVAFKENEALAQEVCRIATNTLLDPNRPAREQAQAKAKAEATRLANVPTLRQHVAQTWRPQLGEQHRGLAKEENTVEQLLDYRFPSVAHGGAEICLGDLKVPEITVNVVREFRAARLDKALATKNGYPRGIVATTANRHVGLLSGMLSSAVGLHLTRNPLADADLTLKPTDFGGKEFEAREFTREEFDRCIEAISKRPHIIHIPREEGIAFFYCGVETMLRCGSLLNMPWTKLRNNAEKGPHFVPLNAKVAKEDQFSALSPETYERLQAIERTDHPYVFGSFWDSVQQPGTLVKPTTAAKKVIDYFYAVCKAAGVPHTRAEDGVTPHSLRHTGATWGVKLANHKTVMNMGGWRSVALFMKKYVHVEQADAIAAARAMFTTKAS